MKIESIQLKGFCAVTHQQPVTFTGGLNILLGPNEAGKSTLIKALQQALFTEVRLTPKRLQDWQLEFTPFGKGGDVEVQLRFSAGGVHYHLAKTWGSSPRALLTINGNHTVTGSGEVQQQLAQILPFKEATFNHVLVTLQGSLANTINNLATHSDVTNSLDALLRQSVINQDGVSVSVFKARLDRVIDDLEGRWDVTLSRPQGNKDYTNPWQKGAGSIVRAYYTLQERQAMLSRLEESEKRYDTESARYAKGLEMIANAEAELATLQSWYDAARQLQVLEPELVNLVERGKTMRTHATAWPVLENNIAACQTRIADAITAKAMVEKEEQNATLALTASQAITAYNKAKELQQQLEQAQAGLQAAKPVEEQQLKALRLYEKQQRDCAIKLEAQQLIINLQAKAAMQAGFKNANNTEQPLALHAGAEVQLTAQGKFSLQLPDVLLTVTAGQGDVDTLLAQEKEVVAHLQSTLAGIGAASVQQAEAMRLDYMERQREAAQRSTMLASHLGNESMATLAQRAAEALSIPKTRELGEVRQALAHQNQILAEARAQLAQHTRELGEINSLYPQGREHLEDLLLDARAELREKQKARDTLPLLPPEYANAGNFITDFEAKKQRRQQMEATLASVIMEKSRLEGERSTISTTVEELREQIAQANTEWERGKAQLKAAHEVRARLAGLEHKLFSNIWQPLQQRASHWLAAITNGKYSALAGGMDNIEQLGMQTGTGTLGNELLSKGTKDALALAIRLAMAQFYLENHEGVFILDDPLLDFDPARQQAAVSAIKQFAAGKQVILLTCQPSHALQFETTVVEIGV